MEKEYKIIYERKSFLSSVIILGIVAFVLAYIITKNWNLIGDLVGSANAINIWAIIGFMLVFIFELLVVFEFIGELRNYDKERFEGILKKEEENFKGKLVEIQEIKYPLESKHKKIKYKTIFKSK